MSTETSRLNQPLPATVAVGSPRWWLSYRAYPVFSAAWVWRRALLFGLLIVLWGVLSGVYFHAEGGSGQDALLLTLYFIAGLTVMINAGPVMAALIRHQGLAAGRERRLVIAAVGLGLVVAFFADMWSSGAMMRLSDHSFERDMRGQALIINILVLIGIYTVIGGGLALRAYLSEHRRLAAFEAEQSLARLEAEKLTADQQLAMLQAQIEPHFLFNSLATIRSDIRQQPEQAEHTLDALCDYLRASIPRLGPGEAAARATLAEQLAICRHYLTVMKSRMRGRLRFSIHADEALGEMPFPPYILLTLVENAIRHGLEPKAEGGQLEIRIERVDDWLHASVSDSGVGLSSEPGNGLGLSNIRRQLKLRYGAQARLRLEGRPEGGVKARIDLPIGDRT